MSQNNDKSFYSSKEWLLVGRPVFPNVSWARKEQYIMITEGSDTAPLS